MSIQNGIPTMEFDVQMSGEYDIEGEVSGFFLSYRRMHLNVFWGITMLMI
jgi:hypothetical protein